MDSAHEIPWSANLAGLDPWGMRASRDGPGEPGDRGEGGHAESRDDLRRAEPFRPPFPPGARVKFSDSRTWLGQFWRGPKVRRGGVRAAVLVLLTEGPRNGYQIIHKITERSGGIWRPSSGSVYPALQQLEDEGLIRISKSGTRRLFELSGKGRTYVETHADELDGLWEAVSGTVGEQAMEMRELLGHVAMAAFQVLQAGSDSDKVRRVLVDTRRSLYRILVEREGDSTEGTKKDTQT